MSKQPTHEDWEAAKQRREQLSRRVVNAVLNGEGDVAEDLAARWMNFDDEMLAISNILDGDGSETVTPRG